MVYDDAGKLTFDSKRDGVQTPPMDGETRLELWLWGILAVLIVYGMIVGLPATP